MLTALRNRQGSAPPIKVAVVGLGSMGRAVARQIAHTPGMQVVLVADRRPEVLERNRPVVEVLRTRCTSLRVTTATRTALDDTDYDVLVECTTAVGAALDHCLTAIGRGAHVVLMNAEVDLAFGRLLARKGNEAGVVVTSDAGDQHGVIARLWQDMQFWGFDLVQAGNIKGFLDRYATPTSVEAEAALRRLDPVPCCAYTDGTKLNIEMALLANGFGWKPSVRGMQGPPAADVGDVLDGRFDFDAYGDEGRVDYVLGAAPGGGVYCVGRPNAALQDFNDHYLWYYKLGDGPRYLFYRPYHLCHLETPTAVAQACLLGTPLLQPWHGPVADVYAVAKRDLSAGEVVPCGIGSEQVYGLIDTTEVGRREGLVPVWFLEPDESTAPSVLTRPVPKDRPLTFADLRHGTGYVTDMLARQERSGDAGGVDRA